MSAQFMLLKQGVNNLFSGDMFKSRARQVQVDHRLARDAPQIIHHDLHHLQARPLALLGLLPAVPRLPRAPLPKALRQAQGVLPGMVARWLLPDFVNRMFLAPLGFWTKAPLR